MLGNAFKVLKSNHDGRDIVEGLGHYALVQAFVDTQASFLVDCYLVV